MRSVWRKLRRRARLRRGRVPACSAAVFPVPLVVSLRHPVPSALIVRSRHGVPRSGPEGAEGDGAAHQPHLQISPKWF
ncbi:small nuclear ribonucleoprotein E isoform X3 [Monodelphis domestica]|uniref:small nuclear ribonucleoprotein E isoform X3 n=1 Tax=Monodelphis domestica TaxID=13616 RepID=UPI0007B41A9F|nr:small nuclear ribonucleoprotein E isoform X3 [Monodelphis domestica]